MKKLSRVMSFLVVFVMAMSVVMTAACRKHTHTYGEWVIDQEATCAAEGTRHRTCTDPNCPDKGNAAQTQTEKIPKTADHRWGENGICTVCGTDKANFTYTYRTYTAVSPSNWNELTYQDNNDRQIMNHLTGSFFEADYKLIDESKPVSKDNIVSGEFTTKYSFATKVEDVTSTYVGEQWGLTESDKARAWKLTIRSDGKWDDGTPIVAGDFVYSMKEQLNPLFKNYRADSYYVGSQPIHNAMNYFFQNQTVVVDNGESGALKMDSLTKGEDGVYTKPGDGFGWVKFGLKVESAWCGGKTLADYADYLNAEAWQSLQAFIGEDGYAPVTDETIALLTTAISTEDWGESASDLPSYLFYEYTYPEMSFDKVGLFAVSDTELVTIFDQPLSLLDEEGKLTYHCFYEFSSLPLVHKAKYEANKVAPAGEGELWTSRYNSSVDTTASWGPYKLTEFQGGKYYVLERNPYFYGFTSGLYEGLFQTDRIECETIADYKTALLKFEKGELDDIGIDASVAADYKGSSQAIFTPNDFVGSLQLQSSKEALKARETDGVNKTILSYQDFRKAISLSFDRATYTRTCTTSSLAGFGLFNSMHYYDVANGKVYRNTDTAKRVLCDIYGINVDDYVDLDEAYEAITGFDIAQARQLIDKAYNEALAAGDIKAADKVVLVYGSSADTVGVRRNYEFIKNSLIEMCKGTSLEGRIDVTFDATFGAEWAKDFRKGAYDICQGGWSGAAWNPGYFLMAYLSPQHMYSSAWNTTAEKVQITVHGVKKDASGMFVVTNDANDSITETLPAFGSKASEGQNNNWYQLLNVEWGQGILKDDFRLDIIAGLEKLVLQKYYSVPISYTFDASMISKKIEYVTREYNTFVGYGGVMYMTYNHSDKAWSDYVKAQGGTINYKG